MPLHFSLFSHPKQSDTKTRFAFARRTSLIFGVGWICSFGLNLLVATPVRAQTATAPDTSGSAGDDDSPWDEKDFPAYLRPSVRVLNARNYSGASARVGALLKTHPHEYIAHFLAAEIYNSWSDEATSRAQEIRLLQRARQMYLLAKPDAPASKQADLNIYIKEVERELHSYSAPLQPAGKNPTGQTFSSTPRPQPVRAAQARPAVQPAAQPSAQPGVQPANAREKLFMQLVRDSYAVEINDSLTAPRKVVVTFHSFDVKAPVVNKVTLVGGRVTRVNDAAPPNVALYPIQTRLTFTRIYGDGTSHSEELFWNFQAFVGGANSFSKGGDWRLSSSGPAG